MGQKDSPKILLLSFVVIAVFGLSIFILYGDKKINTPTQTNSILRNPRTYTVYYQGQVFSPTNLRIHVGDSVRFQNDSELNIKIAPDKRDGLFYLADFDSKAEIVPGSFFMHKFDRAGSFGYKNSLAKNEIGTIIVRP